MTKTILIVEDDPFIAMDLQDTFETAGYDVLGPVAAVKTGLKLMKSKKPDVAMLDYNLGRETSLAIAHELEADKIPYVFLSGQVKSVIMAGNEKPHMVIAKPFNAGHLISTMNRLIQKTAEN